MAEPQAWFEGFGSSDDGDAVRASLHARNPSDSMQAADLLSLITSATTCADRMMRRRIVTLICIALVTAGILLLVAGALPYEWLQSYGALVRRARAHGIPTPVNQTIVEVVKGLEAAGRRDGEKLDEKALEAAAQDNPRNGRWGEA